MDARWSSQAQADLQGLLTGLVHAEGPAPVAGAVVRLEAGDGSIIYAGALGVARPDTGAAMTAATPIHIASVAKTFTAVLVLKLADERELGASGIDSALGDFGVFAPEVLQRLHRKDGVSRAARITLRHLLSHTSGIRDAMVDDLVQCGGPAPGSLIGRLLGPGGNPSHAWVPWNPECPDDPTAGVINFFLGSGIADQPLCEPGAGFHYSDTGYVMLGLLVEKVTGRPLHDMLRAWICRPLGLDATYLAYRDDPQLGPNRAPESEVYAGAVPALTAGVSLSFDWAGGGIVSTAGDLATFLRALMQGRLFRSQSTLEEMTRWTVPAGLDVTRTGVGLGLFRTACDGHELWGHSGAWGTKMAIEPGSGLIFTGTTNQARSPVNWHHPFVLRALGQRA